MIEATPSQRAAWAQLWAKLLRSYDEDDLKGKDPTPVAADRGTDHQGVRNDGQTHCTRS